MWLVNTGWTGGAFGVGKRMKLSHTRAMVHALLRGDLADGEDGRRSGVRTLCADADRRRPDEVLNPRSTWPDKSAYDEQAKKLAGMFRENFAKFEKFVDAGVKAAGPKG